MPIKLTIPYQNNLKGVSSKLMGGMIEKEGITIPEYTND